MVFAILFGYTLPITPLQILWVNMVSSVALAMALAFEPAEKDVMRRPPREPEEPLLSRLLVWRIVFVSLIIVAGTFGVFVWEREHEVDVDFSRTVAVNTLVLFEIFYLLTARYITATALSVKALVSNRYVLIAIALAVLFQLLLTYTPPMQYLFDTKSVGLSEWLWTLLIASTVFVLVELEKFVTRSFRRPSKMDRGQMAGAS